MMRMTDAQRELVTKNIDIVNMALRSLKAGNDYSLLQDLYQEGCMALCTLATESKSSFTRPLAYKSVRNRMLDWCRKNQTWYRYNIVSNETESEPSIGIEDRVIGRLQQRQMLKDMYKLTGSKNSTKSKGFEALQYRLQGYSNCEIARMYQVPCNHVSAWLARLRSDPAIGKCITMSM